MNNRFEQIKRVSREELTRRLREAGWGAIRTETIFEKDDGEKMRYVEEYRSYKEKENEEN